MRKRFSDIKNTSLFTADDVGLTSIGTVSDLLIEDEGWNIRYLVVTTDAPLSRRVLISPAAIQSFDFQSKSITTTLNSHQVVESPPLNFDQPISRQYEQALVDYYGWPIYWFGRVLLKPQSLETLASNQATESVDEFSDSNLRSANEICGYQIESRNGPAGVMRELVINLESYQVEFASAEISSWLPAESSMFSTEWISHLDWANRKVIVDLTKAALEPTMDENVVPPLTGGFWSAQRHRPA